MQYWFILAGLVALLWGSAGVFAKLSTPRLGVGRMALVITAVEAPMYATAFFVWGKDGAIALEDAVLAASSCLIGVLGFLCFFESVMDGPVAIAGTISAAYPALTVLGALALLSERLTAIQALGIAAIIGGVIALSYEPSPGSKGAMTRRSFLFSFLAFALWGLWSLTSKMAVDRIGAGNLFAFYVLSSLTAPLLYGWFRRMRPGGLLGTDPRASAWLLAAVGLALNVTGAFAYTFALESGSASLVVPISSAYPLVTIVLAIAFLRERLNWLQVPAVISVVAGLVLVGLTV